MQKAPWQGWQELQPDVAASASPGEAAARFLKLKGLNP
jgi:hypothetical protein